MKKIISCIVIIFSVISVPSFAQVGRAGGGHFKQMLKDSLQLTDAQADTVVAVHQEYAPQMRQIFMDQTLSPDDKSEKLEYLKQLMDARLKNTLSADQVEKLEAMQERQHERMRNRGGGMDGSQ